MSNLGLRAILFFLLMSSLVTMAQPFVGHSTSIQLPSGSKVSKLAKDEWNRLILVSHDQIFAFDGQTTQSIMPFNMLSGPIGYHRVPSEDFHYILTDNKIYQGTSQLNQPDSLILINSIPHRVKRFYFSGTYFFYQSESDEVYAINLITNKAIELPYIGGPLRGIYRSDEVLYLLSDELFSFHLSTHAYKSTGLDIPRGILHLIEHNTEPYLVTNTGQLWQLNLTQNKLNFIDKISLESSIIRVAHMNEKIYLASIHHGVIIFDVKTRARYELNSSNGLCHQNLTAFFIDNPKQFWSVGETGVCLITDKSPVIADRELGLINERIAAIMTWQDEIYFSTEIPGLYRISTTDRRAYKVSTSESKSYNHLLSINDEMMLATTSAGRLDLVTNQGQISVVDSSNLHDDYVTALAKIDKNHMYIGTKEVGLWELTKDTFNIWHYEQIYTSRITEIVDLISIFNGDLYIATKNKIFHYNSTNNQISLFYSASNSDIIDFDLRDGWIYLIKGDGVVRIPLIGKEAAIEYFTSDNGLRSTQLHSIQTTKEDLYISDEKGTIVYQLDQFNTTSQNQPLFTFPFQLIKNGITHTTTGTYAATNQGVIELGRKWPKSSFPRLVLHGIEVNDREINPEKMDFISSESRWKFNFAAISPENSGRAKYTWTLHGKEHSFHGETDQRSLYFPYLPPDKYKLTIGVQGQRLNTNKITKEFCIQSPFYTSRIFYLICLFIGLCILAGIIAISMSISSKKIKKRNAQLTWENEKLEWQQKALQLQMNPHFIFNALNSIQSLVGKDDKKAKYYIAKLGKLMRLTLHHSRAKWIPLADEIDILSTYLDLEKLNHLFTFSIDVQGITKDEVAIPPMMLQPIVENAVKHGVHKKSEGGEIHIQFSFEGRKIKCNVRDNGPGITTQKSSDDNHLSISSRVINERMELYSKEGIKVDPIKITDLRTNGSQGTEVSIGLPYKQNTIHDE